MRTRSGKRGPRVAPDLYIACGISGAIQHMVGCKGAKHILTINTDKDAPIMARSDYAIIGDLHEIIPALVDAVKAGRRTINYGDVPGAFVARDTGSGACQR